jgi:hypothetical protein
LAFFLIRCHRKRKEADHRRINRFWRGLFRPSDPAERTIPTTEVRGIGGPAPLQAKSPAESGTFPSRKNFDSFKAAMASRSNGSISKKLPNFFSSPVKREASRGRVGGGNDDAFSHDMAERGWAENARNGEFVEVCLDEDVALEEHVKAERRRMEEVASWDAFRRNMSPFPSTSFSLKPSPREPLF